MEKDSANECLLSCRFPENILGSPEKVLQMIRCKCGTDKPCSQKNLQLLQSTVIVFEVLQLLWEHGHNTWTILDENNDCGDEDDAEEADDDDAADEKQRSVCLCDTLRFIDL